VSGIFHFLNKTPIDWYSKLQSTVETATFCSEYVSGRTATEQVIDLRLTLRYLGVPIREVSMLFGDNESMVMTAMNPDQRLTKRHIGLSYHKVKWAIAAGITQIHHVSSKNNVADILSKHWDMASVWGSLKTLMFWPLQAVESLTTEDKKELGPTTEVVSPLDDIKTVSKPDNTP
jgi:hypothetical protein